MTYDTTDTDADGIVEADVNNQSTDTERVFSDSLPAIRIYSVGDTTYALGSNGVIDSGTAAETVIQSAIDHVHSNATINGDHRDRYPAGWIDGGGLTYTAAGSIQHKDRVGIRDLTLDAAGATGFIPYTMKPTGTRTYCRGVVLDNVTVKNSGDSHGMKFTQGGWAPIARNVHSFGHGGDGLRLLGCVGSLWYNLNVAEPAGNGVRIDDTADINGNYNRVFGGNIKGTGAAAGNIGCLIHQSNRDAPTRINALLGVNFGYWDTGVRVGSHARDTVIKNCWFEGGSMNTSIRVHDSVGVYPVPLRTRILQNHIAVSMSIDDSDATVVRDNSGEAPVTITSNATDTEVDHNYSSLTDSGVRTVIDGVGENGGDPSASGAWNGAGYEGAVVVDTTNNVVYHYRGGAWV